MGLFGDYAVYVTIFVLLAACFIFIVFRIVQFLRSKDPCFLRYTDYVSATALFICTLQALYHLGSIIRVWDIEVLKVNSGLGRTTSETLAMAVQENYNRLNLEFYSVLFFFVLLLLSIFLKNRMFEKAGEQS